ncbi:MAG: SH3 domain-containing protein [Chloroflexi bacterium]|nr:SH3 domain-containing protein [Chloroflexota bacterium]
MKHIRLVSGLVLLVTALVPGVVSTPAAAQSELVAALEVLDAGVEVFPYDTGSWVPINVETLVRAGDSIRTGETGRARVTFFADGTRVVLDPGTEITILEFEETDDGFSLRIEVVAGITEQQFRRLLDAGSSYEVVTPGAAMVVRGTDFSVRVEDDGRSSVITADGLVEASDRGQAAEVPPGFGLRSESGGPLSPVVPARSFEELDAALDGCPGAVETSADVLVNVRLGPGLDFERVGAIAPASIDMLLGVDPSGEWYRINFRGGFGWIYSALLTVGVTGVCDELPLYPEGYLEDSSLYNWIGDEEGIATVVVETANLRTGPGLTYALAGSVPGGTRLTIAGRTEDNEWFRVRTPDGETTWIAAFLVNVSADIDQVGVVPLEDGVPVDEVADEADPADVEAPEDPAVDDETEDEPEDEPGPFGA